MVDRLLASEQHGVRYGRHWLDVLRYADVDERMIAAPGIHHWRDWVIRALNDDLPYDQFVRAQLTGYRSRTRTQMSATGVRSRVEPRPDDQFALGFLARGAVVRDGKDARELPIVAVETVSTAFMGLTVGCAKCHDHMYDPIKQRDFYAMKALFDPLVLRKITLATAAEVIAAGRAADEVDKKRAAIEGPIEAIDRPLPGEAPRGTDRHAPGRHPGRHPQAREGPHGRRAEDRRRLFPGPADRHGQDRGDPVRGRSACLSRLAAEALPGRRPARHSPAGVLDRGGRPEEGSEKSYILTSGDPDRPEPKNEVTPGWPFAPAGVEFREGRIEAFSDWLTAPENPMFARVAVNRLWQWHFGEGSAQDAERLRPAGRVADQPDAARLAGRRVRRPGFRMKEIHRLIVTSDTYKRASEVDPSQSAAEIAADPENARLWHFRLRRLEAEPIWDAVFSAAGDLDLTVGGPSFDVGGRRSGARACLAEAPT